MEKQKEEWLDSKYFHLGDRRRDRLISGRNIINLIKNNFMSEFDCLMATNLLNSGNYSSRGEQVSKILKKLANMGFLIQKNTLKETDKNGRKKARYLYKLNSEEVISIPPNPKGQVPEGIGYP